MGTIEAQSGNPILPNLTQIAGAYNYIPVPDWYVPPPAESFGGLPWSCIETDERENVMYSFLMNQGSPAHLERGNDHRARESLLAVTQLPSLGGKGLTFMVRKKQYRHDIPGSSNCPELMLEVKAQDGGILSSFRAFFKENEWHIQESLPLDQGTLGLLRMSMLHEFDTLVKAYAAIRETAQKITVTVSDLQSLKFFIDNGYEVVPKDQEAVAELLARLEAGDSTLVLTSCEADFHNQRAVKRTWHVFDRAIYDNGLQTKWYDSAAQTPCYKFKLHKPVPVEECGRSLDLD